MELLWILLLLIKAKFVTARIVFPTEDPRSYYKESFGPCTTPNLQQSLCVYLRECKELYAILTKGQLTEIEVQYLRRSQCGHHKNNVLVCCPPLRKESKQLPIENSLNQNIPNSGVCGTGNFHRIYGGTRTSIDEFPWMALLEYTKPGNRKGYHCGGVLINARYVLTASHCVNGKGIPSNWKLSGVRLGEWDTFSDHDCELNYCSEPVQDFSIDRVIPHEHYNPNSLNQFHDIALLRLKRVVRFSNWIRPICLPTASYLKNATFENVRLQVSGWGKTEQAITSNVKLKADLRGISMRNCRMVYRKHNIMLQNSQICAGGVKGIDSCRGDSGGPLIGLDNSNKMQPYYFLAGIVSYGPTPCGLEGWPGVYTRVGAYLDWIESNIVA